MAAGSWHGAGRFVPPAELERHSRASIPQFVGKRAIVDRPSDNHATHAKGGDRVRRCRRGMTAVEQVSLQETHHRSEDRFKGLLRLLALMCNVARQSDHRA